MRQSSNCKTHGQSIIELVLAISVTSLVVVGLVSVVTVSIYNTTRARQESQAVGLANQGLEWVRTERDIDWTAFYAKAIRNYCLATLDWTQVAPVDGNDLPCSAAGKIAGTEFTRWLIINISTPDKEVDITSKVRWSDSKGNHTVAVSATLSNWR